MVDRVDKYGLKVDSVLENFDRLYENIDSF